MTASYPSSTKVFTTHVNVTEVIDASHPNSLQDEVVAIENTLGTNPQVSTTPSSSGTFTAASTTFSNVNARLANIETGIVADTHTQYVRKASDGSNTITPAASTNVGLAIQAASGQSANLQEWRNSSGTVIAYVDENGNFSSTSTPTSNAGLQDLFMLMGA